MSRRRLRLCVVNPYGYELFDADRRASKVFGGAEVQLYYLATALAARSDVEVSMIVEEPPEGVRTPMAGVRMIGVPAGSAAVGRWRDRLPVPSVKYLRAMARADADVYLQRGGAVLTGDVGLHRAMGRGRFVFMAAHDWDCDRHHLRGRQQFAGRYYLAGLRRADLVVTQSRHQHDTLRVCHGMDSVVQRSVFPAAAPTGPAPRDHVLWVGRCVDWKRPLAFLELAGALPGRRFVMVCPAYEGARRLYDTVVARAAELPNVQFIPFVPFARTEELFRHAAVFVNTSTAEGFPNTFVQAARCGTPVASLDVNPDDTLRTADFGDCAEGRRWRLVEIVDDLVDDHDGWLRRSENAVHYFRREHDLDSVVVDFAAALYRLC
jgi:glycosyltransferase involved in cell wall biosynthesis